MRDLASLVILLALLPIHQDDPSEPPSAAPVSGLRVVVFADGLPWVPKGETEAHILEVGPGGLRIVSEETGKGLIVRLDDGAAFVINPEEGAYQRHEFDAMALAEKRRVDRAERRRKLLESDFSDEKKREYLKKYGLREDGETIVTLQDTGETMRVAGHRARRHVLLENDVPRVTLWMAADVPAPAGLHRFFRDVAFLDEAMVEKITALEGFPLGIDVDLDYKLGSITMSMLAFSEASAELAPETFERPEGLRSYEEIQAEQAAASGGDCPVCGEPVDESRRIVTDNLPGMPPVYYDRQECREKDRPRLMKEALERKRRG